jgi:hypothetical protein
MLEHDSIVTLTEHDTSWSGESDEQPQAASTEKPATGNRQPATPQEHDAEAAAAEEEQEEGDAEE